MKWIFWINAFAVLLACSAVRGESSNYSLESAIDLTGNSSLTEDYWVVSKRDYPRYPIKAARNNVSSCVEFSFVISDSGKAQSIKIIKSIPDKVFDKSATKSLKKYRWEPAEYNTSLEPVLTTLQLDFSIHPIQTVEECISI